MAVAGSLTYDTDINKNGFNKGLKSLENTVNSTGSRIKSIVAGLGIDKLISATFNILNSSIDGAISRLDTLNNYPKVMSNLGVSATKAQKSINKMSDKLSGLPTTLDAGALAVQRFTSANGDVEKSTDYFLALNNAILAGGASTEIQASALEQLSQSYAKGKPDMMEWRSLMTAMPAQLKQVATAMGYVSTDQLGEDLRKGKVSMDDFMDKLVELNEKGTGEFQSFEEQARNSTGGIATSITVAKTQVTKGVTDIISSIEQFLKDEGLGGIGNIISEIGKKSKEVLDMVAGKMPQLLNWIKEHIDSLNVLAGAITSVVVAYTAYKSTLIAISAIQMIQKIAGTASAFIALIPSIRSVKDAMTLLNMTFSMNPIGLVVAAIAGLIAAFIYFWNTSEGFRNFWINLWEGIKSAVSNAINGIKQFFTNLINFVKSNWKGILLFIANPFIGGFKLLYDNCEGFRNFVNNFIQKIKEIFVNGWNAIVSFFTNTIPNTIKKIGESILNKLKQVWNSIVTFVTQTIPKLIKNIIEWFSGLPYKIGYHVGKILGAIVQLGLNLWNWVTVDLPQIIQGIINWFASLPERIQTWLISVINKIINWGINIYNTSIEWISNTVNSIITWFQELPGRIWEWLLKTIIDIIKWGQNVKETAVNKVSEMINTVIEYFKSLPGKIWTWLLNTLTKIGQFAKNMATKGKEGASNLFNNIVNTLKSLPQKMWDIGKNIVEGIWNGIKNAKDWVIRKVKEFAKGIFDGMKDALGIHSPSRLFRDGIGKFIPQGVAVGIEADTDSALKAIDKMNDDVLNKMNKAVSVETGSINADASVKANNSMMNIIQATFNIDGSVDIDGQKAGRLITPYVTKTLRGAGAY